MTMRVLVTGATGFVGLNIVAALDNAGLETYAYVRARSATHYLRTMRARLRVGELDDAEPLAAAMGGIDAVIHCAGNTSCYEHDRAELETTNVRGTRAVVEAALAAKVRRLVYTSTTSTIGAHDDPQCSWNEDTPLGGFRAGSPYAQTKAAAEAIVRGAIPRGLPAVILNPAEVIGAWDHTLQWGRMVLAVCAGQVPFVPPGSASFCAASEVGRAHVAALTQGTPGRRYILGGTDATYRTLIRTIGEVAGVTPAIAPGSYEEHLSRAQDVLRDASRTRQLPLVDPYRMRVFAGHYRFDSARAMRELGYRARPLSEMIRDAYYWYLAHGFIRAGTAAIPTEASA
jgi:dihydroflavonol-4-reductase